MAAAATPPAYSQPIALYATAHSHRVRTAGNDAVFLRLSDADRPHYQALETQVNVLIENVIAQVATELNQPHPFANPTDALLETLWELRTSGLALLLLEGNSFEDIIEIFYKELDHEEITVSENSSASLKNLAVVTDTSLAILDELQQLYADTFEVGELVDSIAAEMDEENIREFFPPLQDLDATFADAPAEVTAFFQGWIRHSLSAEAGLVAALWVQSGELTLTEPQQYLLAEAIATQTDALIKLAKSVEMPGSEAFVTRDEFLLELAEANTAPPRRATYTTLDHLFAD